MFVRYHVCGEIKLRVISLLRRISDDGKRPSVEYGCVRKETNVSRRQHLRHDKPDKQPVELTDRHPVRQVGYRSDAAVPLINMHLNCNTRSTGTVHTSAKASLTSVTTRIRTRIRIRDPDRHQNLIICSMAHR